MIDALWSKKQPDVSNDWANMEDDDNDDTPISSQKV